MSHFPRSPMCSIYLITNMVNGKKYIGQTWASIAYRWRQHRKHTTCRRLFSSIQAHGVDAFRIELLTITATQEIADYFEAYFIDRYRTLEPEYGYNIRGAGARGRLSLETRAKMSAAHQGKTISPEQREKLRAANIGKKHPPRSDECREKIGATHRGRKRSIETRERLSKSHMGRTHSPETRAKMSATHKGMTISHEVRAKMNATRRAISPEERFARGQKMWATRRERAAVRQGPTEGS